MSNFSSPRAQRFSLAISTIVSAAASAVGVVGRVLADKKVQGSEYFELLLAAAPFQQIVVNAAAAAKEWRLLEDYERAQVAADFAAQFDIPSDDAEAKIEATLRNAVVLETAVEKAFKAVKDTYATWKPVTVTLTVDVNGNPIDESPAPAKKKSK